MFKIAAEKIRTRTIVKLLIHTTVIEQHKPMVHVLPRILHPKPCYPLGFYHIKTLFRFLSLVFIHKNVQSPG